MKMKTRMMDFATGPSHENAGAIFAATAHDRPAVDYKR